MEKQEKYDFQSLNLLQFRKSLNILCFPEKYLIEIKLFSYTEDIPTLIQFVYQIL